MAIAELGQAALTGVDPFILLGQACALVEMTLGIGHCRALELTPGGRMVVRAAMGSNTTFLHCDKDDEENESIGMVTFLADAPLTFSHAVPETRIKWSHLRDFHRVQSGAGVVIRTQYGPFGVLLVFADDERTFSEYEIGFLKSTASILGEALARGRTESALRKSEARLKQLISTALDAVVTVDRNGIVIEWNPQAATAFGIAPREVIGQPVPRGIFPKSLHRILHRVLSHHRTGSSSGLSHSLLQRRRIETVACRGTETFPVEITMERAGAGADVTLTAFIRDISERKRAQDELERREKRFRTIVEKSWSGVALLDSELRFSFAGSSTHYLIGYDEHELLGVELLDYVHPRDRENALKTFEQVLRSPNQEAHGELRFRHKNGTWVWLEGFSQNLLHEPSVQAIVLNYRDVTQRKETEKQLEYHAYYDSLTGLPNRLLFRDRVVNTLSLTRRNRRGLAIMYLDLDHFKLVNDGLGHSFGDLLLADVARRLQSCLRASDTISRIGGDEFSILVSDVDSTDAVAGVARKILDSISRPFSIDGHELFVTASIGISFFPSDGDDVETLLKCADAAMYRAKELGRNQSQLFTASMNERYVRRLALEQALHYAIERNEFELYYQPIYARTRRQIVSFEALVRWNDPQRGMIPPSEFIPLAEETGMIVGVGEWVLRTACAQLREWHLSGLEGLRMAVNISAVQLQSRTFPDLVRRIAAEHLVPAPMLHLEITESAAMANVEQTMSVLAELRAQGFGISVDDFGTGQSSLNYLRQFPIDTVKIDKDFLRDVTSDDTAASIVAYVINLAHTLKLSVVAEGVETEQQYTFLRHYGCDLMQGYLFSKPLPAAEAYAFARNASFIRPRTLEMRRPEIGVDGDGF
jgi:diguanylate cyclase (GGDEF)-like protein/PAS domain S-box-containing protein